MTRKTIPSITRRGFGAAAGAAAALGAWPALAQSAEEGIMADKVKVGTSTALSGTLAYMGKATDEAMRVYFGMVNEKGGVHGRKIEIVTYDDEFKPANAVANAKLLVERDKVLALVGPLGTPTMLAAYEYLESKGVPIVGGLSISDAVTNPPRKLLYALPSPQSTEAPAYVDYAADKLNAKSFGILYQNDSWGKPALEFAEARIKARGLKVAETQAFERLTNDMTSQVAKLRDAKPDVVILYALGQQAALFFQGARKLGWNPTVFGAGGLNDPKFVELLGKGGNEKLFVASYYDPIDGNNPAIVEFRDRYKKAYPNSALSPLALMGYSAAAVFAEALERAGKDATRAKLIAALDAMRDFDQKIGPKISFQPLGAGPYARRGQTGVVLMALKDGKFESLGVTVDPVKR